MHSTGKEQQEGKDVACPFSRAFSPSLAIDLRHLGGLLFTNAISPTELASIPENGAQESIFNKRAGLGWHTLKS